jgi:hypothetical protein
LLKHALKLSSIQFLLLFAGKEVEMPVESLLIVLQDTSDISLYVSRTVILDTDLMEELYVLLIVPVVTQLNL